MDERDLFDELAQAGATRWAKIIRKASALRAYAAQERPTGKDLARLMAEIGCSRKQAYNYVNAFRMLNQARGTSIADAGTEGHGPPSATMGTAPSLAIPAEQVTAVLDCVTLGLDLDTGSGACPARLMTVVTAAGNILAQRLLACEPSVEDLEKMLGAIDVPPERLTWTMGVDIAVRYGRPRSEALRRLHDPSPEWIEAGLPLRRSIGDKIGMIRIMPRRSDRTVRIGEPVPVEIAREAISALIEDQVRSARDQDSRSECA